MELLNSRSARSTNNLGTRIFKISRILTRSRYVYLQRGGVYDNDVDDDTAPHVLRWLIFGTQCIIQRRQRCTSVVYGVEVAHPSRRQVRTQHRRSRRWRRRAEILGTTCPGRKPADRQSDTTSYIIHTPVDTVRRTP